MKDKRKKWVLKKAGREGGGNRREGGMTRGTESGESRRQGKGEEKAIMKKGCIWDWVSKQRG